MSTLTTAALTQLITFGALWTSLHCAGMCGPIVGGVCGARRRPFASLLHYQLGRAVGLSSLGAIAGGVVGVGPVFSPAARGVVVVAIGAVLIASTIKRAPRLIKLRQQFDQEHINGRRPLITIGKKNLLRSRARAVLNKLVDTPMLFGLCMTFMPCTITLWALALAAGTASVVGGALVMLTLVVLTTLPLGAATLSLRVLGTRAQTIQRALPAISGAWLVAVGLAALELIAHRHINLFGASIMLW